MRCSGSCGAGAASLMVLPGSGAAGTVRGLRAPARGQPGTSALRPRRLWSGSSVLCLRLQTRWSAHKAAWPVLGLSAFLPLVEKANEICSVRVLTGVPLGFLEPSGGSSSKRPLEPRGNQLPRISESSSEPVARVFHCAFTPIHRRRPVVSA